MAIMPSIHSPMSRAPVGQMRAQNSQSMQGSASNGGSTERSIAEGRAVVDAEAAPRIEALAAIVFQQVGELADHGRWRHTRIRRSAGREFRRRGWYERSLASGDAHAAQRHLAAVVLGLLQIALVGVTRRGVRLGHMEQKAVRVPISMPQDDEACSLELRVDARIKESARTCRGCRT